MKEVDEKVRPLVSVLKAKGYFVTDACEGHQESPWVDLADVDEKLVSALREWNEDNKVKWHLFIFGETSRIEVRPKEYVFSKEDVDFLRETCRTKLEGIDVHLVELSQNMFLIEPKYNYLDTQELVRAYRAVDELLTSSGFDVFLKPAPHKPDGFRLMTQSSVKSAQESIPLLARFLDIHIRKL